MVEACYRGDEIEAAARERVGHHIAYEEAKCRTWTDGVGERFAVDVDCDYFAAPLCELAGEQAATTADIERTGAVVRNSAKNKRMILNVMTPGVIGHGAGIYLSPIPASTPRM